MNRFYKYCEAVIRWVEDNLLSATQPFIEYRKDSMDVRGVDNVIQVKC